MASDRDAPLLAAQASIAAMTAAGARVEIRGSVPVGGLPGRFLGLDFAMVYVYGKSRLNGSLQLPSGPNPRHGGSMGSGYERAQPSVQDVSTFEPQPSFIDPTGELSWLVFTLVPTVPLRMDKPTLPGWGRKGISYNGIAG
jgi:hypothetical protein